MKIYLTSASNYKTSQYEKLKQLWALSSKKHSLCQQARQADLIVVSDIGGPGWFRDLRENKNIKDPSKCFVVADGDIPMPLLHGVYTSNHRNLKFKSRFRTGAYNLLPKEVCNPVIASYSEEAYGQSKKFLYSFVGQDSSSLRLQLFQRKSSRSDVCIVNSTPCFNAYRKQEGHRERQDKYCEIMAASKFVLCPKGTSGASIRLFESMKMGIATVIISDDWILPQGPKWDEFAIFIKEKNLNQLDALLEKKEKNYVAMGKQARKAYQDFFADEVYFDYLIDQFLIIQASQKIPEYLFWSFRNIITRYWMLQRQWRFLEK